MFHAEDDKILNQHQDHHGHSHLSFEGARSYQRFLETRPKGTFPLFFSFSLSFFVSFFPF